MKGYDVGGNLIAATLFETYLAKLIIENSEFYQALYIKIAHSIRELIQINTKNTKFNRVLYACFSLVDSQYHAYKNIDDFIKVPFDINAANYFHKLFFEKIVNQAEISALQPKKPCLSLSEICQKKVQASSALTKQLREALHPISFFSEINRGRIEIDNDQEILTKKIGIATDENTPKNLQAYYSEEHYPAQFQFKREKTAFFSQLLKNQELPFISGASGTLGTCLIGMLLLDTYSAKEIKLYCMVLAAGLVARGHHSFYEIMCIAELFGFKLKYFDDKKLFYEQFLTTEFLQSEQYQNFINDPITQTYLLEMNNSVKKMTTLSF